MSHVKSHKSALHVTRCLSILLSAGKSSRMKGIDKVNIEVCGKPLWKYSFETLEKFSKVFIITKGGKTRFDSAKIGFEKVCKSEKLKDSDIIIVHNAANPFVDSREIELVIEKAKKHGAAITGNVAIDTVKIRDGKKIIKTFPREKIFLAQTPQAFQVGILKHAYAAHTSGAKITDESALVESIGIKPHWIPASPLNKKITTREDLDWMHAILAQSRTGVATDSHAFDTKGTLKIAGISIKKFPKLHANSDGDVALHALATAISQALGQGSLGTFADTIVAKGTTDSAKFLKPLFAELKKQNLKIGHLGLHFECKNPKIDPLVPFMKKSLCTILKIKSEQIGITSTSGEMLSAFGKGKGIHCTAVVTLWKK